MLLINLLKLRLLNGSAIAKHSLVIACWGCGGCDSVRGASRRELARPRNRCLGMWECDCFLRMWECDSEARPRNRCYGSAIACWRCEWSAIFVPYSGFRSYEVHLSPLLACGEGVGGGVLVPHNTGKCCNYCFLIKKDLGWLQ
jgi:hypothetical protein